MLFFAHVVFAQMKISLYFHDWAELAMQSNLGLNVLRTKAFRLRPLECKAEGSDTNQTIANRFIAWEVP